MSLALWLPLQSNLNNQGLADTTVYRSTNLTYAAGNMGKCLQFKGNANQILSFKNVPQKANNFTWACWVKQTNRTSTTTNSPCQYILSMGRDCGAMGFNINIYNGILRITLGSGTTQTESDTSSKTSKTVGVMELALNTWYHICTVVDDKKVYIYVNGSLKTSFDLIAINYYLDTGKDSAIDTSSYFTIGKMAYNHTATSTYFPFDGYIGDVRVYDNAISPREVKEISKGLCLHYPLNNNGSGVPNLYSGSPTEYKSSSCDRYRFAVGEQKKLADWGLSVGDTITLGFYIKTDSGKKFRARVEFYNSNSDRVNSLGDDYIQNGEGFVYVTTTVKSGYEQIGLYADCNLTQTEVTDTTTEYYKLVKFEKNSRPTPWIPNKKDALYSMLGFNSLIEYDTSGFGNHGKTVSGSAPAISSDSPRNSCCYEFNGSNTYVDCGNSFMAQGKSQLTVSCWAYMNDWTKFNRLYSCTEGGGFNLEVYNGYANNAINVYTDEKKTSGSYISNILSNYFGYKLADLSKGWHLLSFTYNKDVGVRYYLDGKLYAEYKLTSYGIHYNTAVNLYLGCEAATTPVSPYFNGKISDFRIYGTALSDTDIMELYNTPVSLTNTGTLMTQGEFVEK